MKALLFLLAAFAGFQINGLGSGGGSAPIVGSCTGCSPSTPASNGGTVGMVSATNTPTSWCFSPGCTPTDSTGDFSINSSGVITFTSQGATDYPGTCPGSGCLKSASFTVTANNASGSGNGTVSVNAYADGSVGAQAGSAQHPLILNPYAFRPSWKVAGVDYGVGAVAALCAGGVFLDPATILNTISGVSGNNSTHVATISGNNVTLTCYDFGLENGWQVDVTGNNATLTNDNFKIGTNKLAPLLFDIGAVGGTVKYVTLDANQTADTVGFGCVICIEGNAAGTWIIEYVWMLNITADFIDVGIDNPATAGQAYTVLYNIFENGGFTSTGHPDYFQTGANISYGTITLDFNTPYQSVQPTSGQTQGFNMTQTAPFPTFSNGDISYNSFVTPASLCWTNTASGCLDPPVRVDHTLLTGTVTVNSNYIDPTGIKASNGATGSFFNDPNQGGTHNGTATLSGNIQMPTGAACNTKGGSPC